MGKTLKKGIYSSSFGLILGPVLYNYAVSQPDLIALIMSCVVAGLLGYIIVITFLIKE
ncbi:hypothetical protein U8V72_15370 [Priestia filamentosa]|uniref:hypothetical protein n=1 Tax=Priestia filamentosa TaxID=1402861 RepID=UPI000B1E6B1F